MNQEPVYGVSDFVAYLNQTLELAYPYVTIEGELANFKVSKNRWVYFDLKDETASVRCFGTVYSLPGPLEDGMVVRVSGNPRLHPQFGFSLNYQTIQPVGEGALKRAADLLAVKLAAEGLFEPDRKRTLPYPPKHIALVTAGSSAAYADFTKITNARWRGMQIDHYDVLVQGAQAPSQISKTLNAINALATPPEIIVLTRGGGSAEDLAAFSTEQVTRAVAGSRVPTLVAIGHESDISLAELAADRRASTPSNAAELLTPNRTEVLRELQADKQELAGSLMRLVRVQQERARQAMQALQTGLIDAYERALAKNHYAKRLLDAYDPAVAFRRGYAMVRHGDNVVLSTHQVAVGDTVDITLHDGTLHANITGKDT